MDIPENLGDLSTEELTELATGIADRVGELAGGDLTAEVVDEMESLADSADRVTAEVDERARLAQAAASVMERMARPEAEATVEVTDEVEVEEASEVVDEVEVDTPDIDADDAAAAAAVVDVIEAGAPHGTAAVARISSMSARPSALVQRMNAVRDASAHDAPAPSGARLQAQFVGTSRAGTGYENRELSTMDLAAAIIRRHSRLDDQRASNDRVVIAQAVMPYPEDETLSGDVVHNFGLLRRLQAETFALVASGGNCAPSAPVYDIFRTAESHSPVEDNLPVVGATRGSIRWIQPPDFADAAGGIGVTTNDEDEDLGYANGEDRSVDVLKPCIRVECPETLELYATAVSQCVVFGNQNYKSFPEQVAAFLEDLAWQFSSTKETLYLDRIEAGSTAVTTTQVYGATRSILRDALQAAAGYRLRNGMSIDSPLDWYVPVWTAELIKADMIADASMGMGFLTVSTADVAAALRSVANLNVVWTYDGSTNHGDQAFRSAQAAGALNEFPTDAVTYMHAPGTFFRIDDGTLDVGIVRDSVLNRTNDLQLFSEQWVEAGKAGVEGLAITHANVCPSGEAPLPDFGNLLCAGS